MSALRAPLEREREQQAVRPRMPACKRNLKIRRAIVQHVCRDETGAHGAHAASMVPTPTTEEPTTW